jgi:hypothetical protein
MQIELTKPQIQMLLAALNNTPVQGYDAMQAVLKLAEELQAAISQEVANG